MRGGVERDERCCKTVLVLLRVGRCTPASQAKKYRRHRATSCTHATYVTQSAIGRVLECITHHHWENICMFPC
jgi:hypothetical protein